MNAETSQHERGVDNDHNDPEDDPETDARSLRSCPPSVSFGAARVRGAT
jgi:hypothetical protein